MELVVNSCIVFSFFKPDSFTRNLLESLYMKRIKLLIPDFELDELLLLKEKVCKYCKIDEDEFTTSFILLTEILKVVPKSEYRDFLSEADKLLPGHPKDVSYFALALASGCAIWSNEKRFKEQSEVDIFSTDDIKELFDTE